VDRKLHRAVHPLSSAATIQRRSPGLSLEEAQFESAVEQRPWHEPLGTTLEGSPAPAVHAHVSLEGPMAANARQPHLSHITSLEGPRAPLRAALERRYRLEGPTHHIIRAAGIGPALIHHDRKRK
jgi:hypothetical protein